MADQAKPAAPASAEKPKPRWGGAPTTKCLKCGKTLYPAETVKMEDKMFHQNCFRCVKCNKKLDGSNYGKIVGADNTPYCAVHYEQLVASRGGNTTKL